MIPAWFYAPATAYNWEEDHVPQYDKANFPNDHKVTDAWHNMSTQSNALLVVSRMFQQLFWGSCIPTDFTSDEESSFSHNWHKTHHFGCFDQIFVTNRHLITASVMNNPEQGWHLPEPFHPNFLPESTLTRFSSSDCTVVPFQNREQSPIMLFPSH